MPELLLVRHAKSDWPAGIADHERPLSARGRRDAQALGVWLQSSAGPIDRVVVSTATRTRQTWEIASAALDDVPPTEFSDDIYEAHWRSLLAVAQSSGPANRVLLLGHNPGMENLADVLATNEIPAMSEKFPTSALARLSFAVAWDELDADSATLVEFVVLRG